VTDDSLTGPSRPDSSRGESFVWRLYSSRYTSIMRLDQRLGILIPTRFVDAPRYSLPAPPLASRWMKTPVDCGRYSDARVPPLGSCRGVVLSVRTSADCYPAYPGGRGEWVAKPAQLRFDAIGEWSEVKLAIVKEYAKAYSVILAKQPRLQHVYIDAFAGAGLHLSKSSTATTSCRGRSSLECGTRTTSAPSACSIPTA